LRWAAYRNKRGSFNIGMRVEEGCAVLATVYANSKSSKSKFKVTDFMPHMEEPAISQEEAMDLW